MNALNAQCLLHSWERGQAAHPIRRALALLQAARPDVDADEWARLPVGERDRWLLSLYESLSGPRLETQTRCPQCDEMLESSFTTRDILPAPPELPAVSRARQWRQAGYELGYRLPTSADLLLAIESDETAERAQSRLLSACVTDARFEGRPFDVADLPAEIVAGLEQEMASQDPGADTRVRLACPACGHSFDSRFDIVAYLWSELDDWAQRTLAEVHALATAYGWTEQDILGLSAARRQHYIELVRA